VTAASLSAGTDVLRHHCDLNDVVERPSKWNRTCNRHITQHLQDKTVRNVFRISFAWKWCIRFDVLKGAAVTL